MIARELARDVVRVTGPEATAYLQGQLSQDVEGLAIGASAQSLLLEPTGKLGLVVRVTRQADDDLLLDVPAGWGDALAARLQRFKLRTKADIERVEGWRCVAVRGDGDEAVSGAGSGWPTWPGDDLLGPDPQPPDGVRLVDADEWTRSRILAGVPELGCELAEGMIPAEGGRVLIDATVSFTKGCYTGQELVARVDSRGGNVPRRVLGLRLADGGSVPVGAAVGERGAITSAAGDVALALVPRGSAAGDTVPVTWDGGRAEGTLVDLPFDR